MSRSQLWDVGIVAILVSIMAVNCNQQRGVALSEGLYWMAEKLLWGYEGVDKDPAEAFRLFKQAANLGCSDAQIRLGQLHEYGKGTKRDPSAAFLNYQGAAEAGNFYGFAFLARLLSRSTNVDRADGLWERFFAELNLNQEPKFLSASPGELLHDYVRSRVRLGQTLRYISVLSRFRMAIVGYHQQLVEHTDSEQAFKELDTVSDWLKSNLGPWG